MPEPTNRLLEWKLQPGTDCQAIRAYIQDYWSLERREVPLHSQTTTNQGTTQGYITTEGDHYVWLVCQAGPDHQPSGDRPLFSPNSNWGLFLEGEFLLPLPKQEPDPVPEPSATLGLIFGVLFLVILCERRIRRWQKPR
jgi:hypothetical protein